MGVVALGFGEPAFVIPGSHHSMLGLVQWIGHGTLQLIPKDYESFNLFNAALGALALYLVIPIINSIVAPFSLEPPAKLPSTPDLYSWMPEYPPVSLWRTFTPRDLAPYNGIDKPQILFAVNRKVFDVSTGRSFYGPGGPYENFAGRDASRGMAKQSFDESMLSPIEGPIDPLTDLTPFEKQNMLEWEGMFLGKYVHCGVLEENELLP